MYRDSTYGTSSFIVLNIIELNRIITDYLKVEESVQHDNFNPCILVPGQTIQVRDDDYDYDDWEERIFMDYDKDREFPFICEHSLHGKSRPIGWKYAKVITE